MLQSKKFGIVAGICAILAISLGTMSEFNVALFLAALCAISVIFAGLSEVEEHLSKRLDYIAKKLIDEKYR
jgi:hypothetical protein